MYFCFSQYEDDDGDRVLLATDSDLVAAISHARLVGQKVMVLACVDFAVWIFIYIYIYILFWIIRQLQWGKGDLNHGSFLWKHQEVPIELIRLLVTLLFGTDPFAFEFVDFSMENELTSIKYQCSMPLFYCLIHFLSLSFHLAFQCLEVLSLL